MRDLGRSAVSDGRLNGLHIGNTGDTGYALDWHGHDNDFHFFYVLGGSFVLDLEDGRSAVMKAGSAAALPRLHRHAERDFSADF